jgi:zinc protease
MIKKYIFTLLITSAIATITRAQEIAKPYDMTVDGVQVIVQPSGNDIVEIQTIIRGGVQNYPVTKMGIESMAMNALSECGTLKHDHDSFNNALDKVSAYVYGSTNRDYSVIRMNCIKTDFNTVWPLYVETITEPGFDTTQFNRIKQDAINNLRARESNPDAGIDKLANKVAFAGRDYAKDPDGTPEIIKSLTAAETHAYYNSILTRSRMFIVVVADMDKAAIEQNVHTLLVNIKKGAPFESKKEFFRVYNNTFTPEQRDLATNYVEGVTSGPQADAPDFDAFRIAMNIFAQRHFLDIRTNHGLSYAPQAWFSSGSTSVAKFSVTTTQPDKYIAVFNNLVDSTKQHGFTAEELANMKIQYLTSFYAKNETNQAQAGSIAGNQVLHGDWKRSQTVIADVKKITVEDINNAFSKYIGNIVWVYQGDTKKVTPKLYTSGTAHPDNPVSQ